MSEQSQATHQASVWLWVKGLVAVFLCRNSQGLHLGTGLSIGTLQGGKCVCVRLMGLEFTIE